MSDFAEKYRKLVAGQSHGLRATLARLGLRALSGPYAFAVAIRNQLYDSRRLTIHKAEVPVVSVGNLTLGGTGKTPCVEYLARFFRDHDVRVAILSRGYGRAGGQNDEALVLEDNLPDVPHLQGPNRAILATTAIEELETELLILDDGFQHRKLARDLDIVLVDALDPWGGNRMFPAGLMREPRKALRRADTVIVTRTDAVDRPAVDLLQTKIKSLNPDCPVVLSKHAPMNWQQHDECDHPLEAMQGQRVLAFCGLGSPAAFRLTLESLGVVIADFRIFPDHHLYTKADVESLAEQAKALGSDVVLVTTQKDAVKLRTSKIGPADLYSLRIELQMEAGPALDRWHGQLAGLIRS